MPPTTRRRPETNSTAQQTTQAAINENLTPTTYGQIKPGDRVVHGFLNPTHPNAHHLARPVREIVRTYRNTGFTPNWALPRAERIGRPLHGFTYYDYEVIVWRDTNGSLFEDCADETVYIAPATARVQLLADALAA